MQKQPFSYYTVRFSDCDLFGHLNNARYIDYFLNAREDHLKNAYQLSLKDFYQQGLGWLVTSHEIYYLKPADYNENIYIQSALLKANEDSLNVEMLMMDEKKTHLKAIMRTKFVAVNIKTGKREKHTAAFMEFATSIEFESDRSILSVKERIAEVMALF
jgi:YbgC/YbaW family acyl-CoA thioester hydrolase